jgi:hypothetical protein
MKPAARISSWPAQPFKPYGRGHRVLSERSDGSTSLRWLRPFLVPIRRASLFRLSAETADAIRRELDLSVGRINHFLALRASRFARQASQQSLNLPLKVERAGLDFRRSTSPALFPHHGFMPLAPRLIDTTAFQRAPRSRQRSRGSKSRTGVYGGNRSPLIDS